MCCKKEVASNTPETPKSKEDKTRPKTFDKSFWGIFIPFLVFIVILLFFPYFFTQFNLFHIDFSKTGQIGDTLGGVMGPFIGIAAAILTFLAFWVQIKANKNQDKQFEDQNKQWTIERFESKFYELVHLHRENVSEITIRNKHEGRRAFVVMYNEFRFCFYLVKNFVSKYPIGTSAIDLGFERDDDETIAKIAYLIFFNGTGDKSDKLLIEPLNEICQSFFYLELLKIIKGVQDNYQKRKNENEWCKLTIRFGNKVTYTHEATYKPFMGHISRLGHYYRHLFQTVKYVDEYDKYNFDDKERYNYLKTLRAQLSSHEQILLYYNCLTSLGNIWLDKKHPYLIKYKMIKNIPLPIADFGIRPEEKFKDEIVELRAKGEELFEWHEGKIKKQE